MSGGWKESDHPRSGDGEFARSASGASTGAGTMDRAAEKSDGGAAPARRFRNVSASAMNMEASATPRQRDAINRYSGMRIADDINYKLRYDSKLSTDDESLIQALDEVVESGGEWERPQTVNRGMRVPVGWADDVAERVGKTLTLGGFSSTSIDREQARVFGPVMLEITTNRGAPIWRVGPAKEYEVLLGRGWRYRVDAVDKSNERSPVVKLTMVEASSPTITPSNLPPS